MPLGQRDSLDRIARLRIAPFCLSSADGESTVRARLHPASRMLFSAVLTRRLRDSHVDLFEKRYLWLGFFLLGLLRLEVRRVLAGRLLALASSGHDAPTA